MTTYTIGQLAEAADVPTTTVRYYERRKLITPEGRSDSNYRVYGEASLQRLRFIRAAQKAGFTLSDIETLLELQNELDAPTNEVQTLIAERLDEVREQISHLEVVRKELERWRQRCRCGAESGHCEVIEGLSAENPADEM